MELKGFFKNTKIANEALQKLHESGFKKALLDYNDHYNDDRNVRTNLPGTETSVSLSGLVLHSDDRSHIENGKEPLVAASPMVSGYGDFEEVADVNCVVIVEVDGNNEAKARQIIESNGGTFDNPNVDKPKIENANEYMIYKNLKEATKDL